VARGSARPWPREPGHGRGLGSRRRRRRERHHRAAPRQEGQDVCGGRTAGGENAAARAAPWDAVAIARRLAEIWRRMGRNSEQIARSKTPNLVPLTSVS
jgi:hypothetical protein